MPEVKLQLDEILKMTKVGIQTLLYLRDTKQLQLPFLTLVQNNVLLFHPLSVNWSLLG